MLKDKKTLILILVILLLSLIPTYYFYNKSQNVQGQLNRELSQKKERKDLLSQVEKLIELPKNEEPTIVLVSDKDKLKGQAFFQNSQNGDKVLIYAQAKKAILFRPSSNKIIEVAPVYLNQNSESTPSATISGTMQNKTNYSTVLLNGTNTVGITNTAEKELLSKFKDLKVNDKDNAVGNYEKVIVVDMQNNPQKATELANFLKGEVGVLPKGEKKIAGVDFLVILGTDYLK